MEAIVFKPFALILILQNLLSYLSVRVLADPVEYCEFGYCEIGERCCGKDICCKEMNGFWYFWAGIIVVIAAIIIVTAIKYFQKKLNRSSLIRHYDPVPNQIIEET